MFVDKEAGAAVDFQSVHAGSYLRKGRAFAAYHRRAVRGEHPARLEAQIENVGQARGRKLRIGKEKTSHICTRGKC